MHRGDDEAFATLYLEFQAPLLRYLRTRESEPEDLAAETWLAVVSNIDKFTGDEAAFRSWLFTIARNRAIDAGRARSRRPVDLVGEELGLLDAAAPEASVAALENVSTASALALVSALPPDQSEAIALRFIAGLDVAQVAAVMGRTPGAVRVLTHRGLRTLEQRLRP